MSAAIVVALAIGAASSLALLVLLWAMYRHVKVLLGAVREYRDEVQPVLEEIRSSGERARARAERVPGRIPEALPGRKPGARLGKTTR